MSITKQQRIVKQAEPTPGQIIGEVAFFDEEGNPVDVGGAGGVDEARLVPEGGNVGQVVKRGEGGSTVWAADQNIAYPPITSSELVAGTSTTQSTVSPKVLADEIDRRIAAAIAALPTG